MNFTTSTKGSDIKRSWYLVDIRDKILGRTATDISVLLMGKKKPYFVPNLDCGDYVVVINASLFRVTGKKESQKLYTQYSGYPGGLKKKTFEYVFKKDPTRIVREAVSGMLPNNKLRDSMLRRLFIFTDDKHPYEEKLKTQVLKLNVTA